jgi:hypothetical protein
MTRGKGTKLVAAIAAGLALGIMLGQAVAMGIRSDNAPFLVALGAPTGAILGLLACYVIDRRHGTAWGKEKSVDPNDDSPNRG